MNFKDKFKKEIEEIENILGQVSTTQDSVSTDKKADDEKGSSESND
ncbi:MAG: hypothetical protein H6621_00680 [Halobacteriovoraceae bacterium]|nr:hypothetical protein [Halobacteriovoraceae bacterium]MCB9093555.1 hypothetical protein [Halobacteriovoraceae bacterium]